METGNPVTTRNSIVDRAKDILLHPREEWPRIEAEPDTPGDIFRRYVVPLAAIGPVARFIGSQVFGYGIGISYRPSIVSALGTAIVGYVMALVGLFVLMFIADALASKFAGVSNRTAAFKLVAYSYTAAWVAGIFGIIPALMILSLAGLYSFYLFYLGATPLMKVPADKAAGYTGVTVLCAIVLYLVVALVTTSVTGLFGGTMIAGHMSGPSGTVSVPGMGSVDLAKMDAASKRMEAATNGKVQPVAPAVLQNLLPASIGSYTRTSVETNAMGPMGAQASGTYTSGDKSFQLQVSDMAAMGALAGLGSALGVAQTREDADGYERTGTVNGQMQSESWSKSGSNGKYAVVVDNRFAVQAEGTANNIDELKSAVAAVDQGKLASLAH